MRVELLDPVRGERLQNQRLTYRDVGATAGAPPAGYRWFSRTRLLPSRVAFDDAAHALLHWQVQLRAGLHVSASSPAVEPDTVALMRLGLGRLAITIPCRVVYVVTEQHRRGFAYGTLPGHPESGEELFLLHHDPGGPTQLTVAAFSRPATTLARAGGPLTTQIQRFMTHRYLHSLNT